VETARQTGANGCFIHGHSKNPGCQFTVALHSNEITTWENPPLPWSFLPDSGPCQSNQAEQER
jgi:hypothetical protein